MHMWPTLTNLFRMLISPKFGIKVLCYCSIYELGSALDDVTSTAIDLAKYQN